MGLPTIIKKYRYFLRIFRGKTLASSVSTSNKSLRSEAWVSKLKWLLKLLCGKRNNRDRLWRCFSKKLQEWLFVGKSFLGYHARGYNFPKLKACWETMKVQLNKTPISKLKLPTETSFFVWSVFSVKSLEKTPVCQYITSLQHHLWLKFSGWFTDICFRLLHTLRLIFWAEEFMKVFNVSICPYVKRGR